MAQHIQHYRDTSTNYTNANPILLSGELGYETNTGMFKIGDGTTSWSNLQYFNPNQPGYNVLSFGAKGDGVTDDAVAFQNTVNALPSTGGRIIVPSKSYVLSIEPNIGSKSIYWDIDVGATFSGAGTGYSQFPSMATNQGQIAVGPYIVSQSETASPTPNGGTAAFNIETLPPSTYVGQSVGLYVGARGNTANTNANVWAINCLIDAQANATGTYQCIEVDVNCRTPNARVKGISVSGVGDNNPDVAFEALRANTTRWKVGVELYHCLKGIVIHGDSTSEYTGLQIENLNSTDTTNKSISTIYYGKGFASQTTKAVVQHQVVPIDSDWDETRYTINIRSNDTLQSVFEAKNTGMFFGLNTVDQTHLFRQGQGSTRFRRDANQYIEVQTDSNFHYITGTTTSTTGGGVGKDIVIRNRDQNGVTFNFNNNDVGKWTYTGNLGIGETSPDYKLDVNGSFGFTPGNSVTPVDNGDVVFELTNNTTLTVKAKGSDGTIRSGTIILS